MTKGIRIGRQLAFSVMLTIVLYIGSVVNPSMANATVYYVATTGNDANPGGQSQPFRTINKGVSILKPGDTLYVRQGTYAESISTGFLTIPSGTSWANAITIASYPGETAALRPTSGGNVIEFANGLTSAYLIFDRLVLDQTANNPESGGLYVGIGNHHIRLSNSELKNTVAGTGSTSIGGLGVHGGGNFIEVLNNNIHDFNDYGFYVRGQNWLIDHNVIHDNGGYGIQIYNSGHNDVSNNTVSNNEIYGNGRVFPVATYAVALASGSNNIAYNNVIRGQIGGSGNGGIQVAYTNGGTNNQVYNNTIYGNQGVGVDIYSSASGTVVKNNIVYNNSGGGISDAGVGTIQSNNLTIDPKFVNASANDFSLQAGSPAIDAGITVSIVTTDMKGSARPQGATYDIGAYEYSQGTTLLPAPNNLRAVAQ